MDEVSTTTIDSAAVELERLRAEDDAIAIDMSRLLAEGRKMREAGATDADLAEINAQLADLQWRRPAPSRLVQLELDAANEKHGLTRLADGNYGKIGPNSEAQSGHGGLAEFTDSDGTVYTETAEDRDWRAERHKVAVTAFKARVTAERVARARRSRSKPTRTGRVTVANRARRTVRTATPSRGDPDDPDLPWQDLDEWLRERKQALDALTRPEQLRLDEGRSA
jgi:hypothetical protein